LAGEQNDSISPEEQIDDLKREVELLHREVARRNQEMMGFITVLCLPMSTKRKLEVGFTIIKELPDPFLREILERYIKEGVKSEMNFDQIIEPMPIVTLFNRLPSNSNANTTT
jgi:hypothetical protein